MFAGLAQRGKTSMGWFFGFKLHLVFNTDNEFVALKLLRTDAKISDAVCWNERGGMPSVWRSQMHHLFLRLS